MNVRHIAFALVFPPLTSLAATICNMPPCDFADTEVSTNIPVTVDFRTMSRFEFALAVDASPSNSIEIAIGTDADGDGNLAPEESVHIFGYDCGTWFERAMKTSSERRFPANDTPQLVRSFALNRHKVDASWNLTKVTRRGFGSFGERATVRKRLPGLKLSIQ